MRSAAKGRRPRRTASTGTVPARRRFALLSGAIVLLLSGLVLADWWITVPATERARYAGGDTCLKCHQQQHAQWHGSHHDLAMQLATSDTVLGDFNNATLSYHGITARMFQRDGQFYVHTEGPDGKLRDFPVKYVFGVEPLQQYMVEFDRPADMPASEIARVQVLRESWDTVKRQWFYLPPPDVDEKLPPDDALHWTGVAQRWNNMCADCHSTNLQKNFDVASRRYHTTFTDIDVNCESCHGPGSIHVDLASSFSLFWDRKRGYGLADLKSSAENEIQACAPCHARRQVLQTGYEAGCNYFDYFATDPPNPSTYFADGQILDEVYEHGSFLQSKMYHRGIRCSDCHDPHTARLRYAGNQVCTSCHQHPAGKYDSPAHHHHQPGSSGASCVECHMPETTYMEVDARRDHSLRVPRPDLSVEFGTPNACTRCHLERAELNQDDDRSAKQYRDWVLAARSDSNVREALGKVDAWAADAVKQWYPPKPSRGQTAPGELLARVWREDEHSSDAALTLLRQASQPAMLRAAALEWLTARPSAAAQRAAVTSLTDPHPLVRAAAAGYFENVIPTRQNLGDASPAQAEHIYSGLRSLINELAERLADSTRLVRTEAARVLARVPEEILARLTTASERQALARALDELETRWLVQNDRGGAHAAMAFLHEMQGDVQAAEEAYRTALRVEPGITGPRSNLAVLLEQRLAEAARLGATATDLAPLRSEIQQLRADELALLERDARLLPDNADLQHRLGLARHLNGQTADAARALRRAHDLEPSNPRHLLVLTLVHQRLKQYAEALRYVQKLRELEPDDPGHRQLEDELQQHQGPPAP